LQCELLVAVLVVAGCWSFSRDDNKTAS
jgi:hypothetical protein